MNLNAFIFRHRDNMSQVFDEGIIIAFPGKKVETNKMMSS